MRRKIMLLFVICTLLSSMIISSSVINVYASTSSKYSFKIESGSVGLQAVPPELECTSSDTVLIIQDVVPFDTLTDPQGANVEEMEVQGKPFCMINSDQISSTNLAQFREILISAAQNQTFYDNLFPAGIIHSDIVAWVEDGGILSANLTDCAQGPGNGGVWATIEVECDDNLVNATNSYVFVGGVRHVVFFADDNDIVTPTHPVITGAFGGVNGGTIVDIASQVDLDEWNFSSHGYFTNLTAGTTVIIEEPDLTGDDVPEPVMIQYPFGLGQVITTLTTTEFRYVGGIGNSLTPNKELLANEIGFQDSITSNCVLVVQPSDPISMNTVRSGNVAKTIHAEKQIFNCSLDQGNIPVIVDVTIFAEIYEDMKTQSVVGRQAMVVTCVKEAESGAVIECGSSIPSQTGTIVSDCNELSDITHPQEMNTVNKGKMVKTIEAQKEVFRCTLGNDDPSDDKKVDVVIFTEIWENLNNLSGNPVVKTSFESLRCIILIGEAEVESCKFSTV